MSMTRRELLVGSMAFGADNAHYFTLCWTYGTNLNSDRAGMKNPGEMTHYGLYRLAWADVRTRT